MKISTKGLGKSILSLLTASAVVAIPAAILAMIVTWLVNGLSTMITGTYMVATAYILAGVILATALKMHKGKENILELIPVLLTILGFTTILSMFMPTFSYVADLQTMQGMALAFAEIILALAIVEASPLKKYAKMQM